MTAEERISLTALKALVRDRVEEPRMMVPHLQLLVALELVRLVEKENEELKKTLRTKESEPA